MRSQSLQTIAVRNSRRTRRPCRSNKNVAARTNDIASLQKPTFLGPLWPVDPLCIFSERIENMVIATLLFLAFIVATGAGIVKAYEWHQDVLYGPYLKRID